MSGYPAFRAICIAFALFMGLSASANGQEEGVPSGTQPAEGAAEGASGNVEAPMTVTVNPGSQALDSVAVPAVLCSAGESLCTGISETISRDLTLSGFFRVLDPVSFIADMSRESLTSTKWEDWFNVGTKYLIKVRAEGGGKNVALSFRLYDVNRRKAIEVSFQDASVGESGVRDATHKFVNEVIRAITGMPGPFTGHILFAAKTGQGTKGVFMMSVDGQSRKTVAADDTINMLPSMVGGTVVYTSFRPGRPAIYMGKKRLSRDKRAYRGAKLKPGGGMLAVSADDGGQSDIFLMSTSGELGRNLTHHWADEVSPVWSPEGDRIAFVSNRTGSPQIYVMNADGSGQRRLTMAGSYNSTPDFGPNGLVVFAGMDEAHSDIFTVDMEGNITRITQDQGSNKDPTISPDGRHLAFVSSRGGKSLVWISTIDGRFQFPITERSSSYSTLFWSR